MKDALRSHLAHKSIFLWKNWFTVNPFFKKKDKYNTSKEEILDLFCTQLLNYKLIINDSTSHYSKIRATVSGKVDYEGKVIHKQTDDLVFTACMTIYYGRKILYKDITIDSVFYKKYNNQF